MIKLFKNTEKNGEIISPNIDLYDKFTVQKLTVEHFNTWRVKECGYP
jgi:hypothetical protein